MPVAVEEKGAIRLLKEFLQDRDHRGALDAVLISISHRKADQVVRLAAENLPHEAAMAAGQCKMLATLTGEIIRELEVMES